MTTPGQREKQNLDHLHDIETEVVVEMAHKTMKLSAVRQLGAGDTIKFDRLAGEAFDLLVNEQRLAEGEIVVITDRLSLRLTGMRDPQQEAMRDTVAAAPSLPPSLSESDPRREMVFIPAGSFAMGASDTATTASERPVHIVDLSAYFIDSFPVTNAVYREFVRATGHKAPANWSKDNYPAGLDLHPVVQVTWQDAVAYAAWAGKRLPTEAEWEKSARGTDERPFPWGDRFVEGERCNSNNMVGTTLPVDEFPDGRSPYGLWDMSGNTYEWCADYYDEGYYHISPMKDPGGPQGGVKRVVRGGSYQETRSAVATTHRNGAAEHHARDNIGIRCAADA